MTAVKSILFGMASVKIFAYDHNYHKIKVEGKAFSKVSYPLTRRIMNRMTPDSARRQIEADAIRNCMQQWFLNSLFQWIIDQTVFFHQCFLDPIHCDNIKSSSELERTVFVSKIHSYWYSAFVFTFTVYKNLFCQIHQITFWLANLLSHDAHWIYVRLTLKKWPKQLKL